MRILLGSLDIVWERKELNFQACADVLHQASQHGVDLVVFPEMSLTGFSMNVEITKESLNNFDTLKSFRNLSASYQIATIFGAVLEKDAKVFNTAIFINKTGEILATYAKIHPFTFAREDEIFTPGSEITTFEFEGSILGLSICYDLRFPEIYSAMSDRAQVIFNIANWPVKRISHWHTLLASRAIENQVFMVGVNRIGLDPLGNTYENSSQIIDPAGKVLEPIFKSPNTAIFDLDFTSAEEYVSNFPTKADRNVQLYKSIL
jgi:omega-amidase